MYLIKKVATCWCALAASCSDIDMENIVGEYELSIVPMSLMSSNAMLHHGGDGKSALIGAVVTDKDDYGY